VPKKPIKAAKPVKPAKSAKPAKGVAKPASRAKAAASPMAAGHAAAGHTLAGPAASPEVLDRLWRVVLDRRDADPAISHSARLLSRGIAKCAQKLGEEAVECIIEAVAGNKPALVAESADVLYHLLVVWVAAGVTPQQVWAELQRREGVSGVAEKAARRSLVSRAATRKIP